MSLDYAALVSKCDGLIKAGRIADVAALLGNLNLAQVPREHRHALAKVCRRSGLIEKGLRLLHPVIRHEKELEQAPSAFEISEYSVLLSRNGSIREALDLLERVDESEHAEALLYRGFCHVSSWDYAQAAGFFERFLRTPADDYSKLIARVNLASSYIATGSWEAAKLLLNEAIALAQETKATRLTGNLFELRGQTHFFGGDFAAARKDLDRALNIFGQGQSYDQLLILKWQSAMRAFEEKSIAALMEFRQEAWRRKHWESVREADLLSLKIEFDQLRFDHLIVGTAAPKYRERIGQLLDRSPGSSFVLGERLSLKRLNLARAEGTGNLKPGRKIHQALVALTRDFYVPRNMGTLFAELYPDEYFNADSSPTRVRQILRRTRRWFEQMQIPAAIAASNSGYRLRIEGAFALEVPFQAAPAGAGAVLWSKLGERFGTQTFSVRQATALLQISSSSFQRLSRWAKDEGLVEISGVGKATRYRCRARGAA